MYICALVEFSAHEHVLEAKGSHLRMALKVSERRVDVLRNYGMDGC